MHLRKGPSFASCVQGDCGVFADDLDEPNSVDEGRVQKGVSANVVSSLVVSYESPFATIVFIQH